jgi:hypothetical protein
MSGQAVKLEAKPKAVVEEHIKEVSMEVTGSAADGMGGGGGKTRRRRRGSRRQKGGAVDGDQDVSSTTAIVQKEGETPADAAITTNSAAAATAKPQAGGSVVKKAAPAPVVVIAPPKKKAPKVTLVPKANGKRAPVKKTFKAKRVRVLIKNRKTIKRQQQALQQVDSMTEVEVRKAAAAAGLTRENANAPVDLLRKMLQDYQTMRGGFL